MIKKDIRFATITRVWFGIEDHGIMTFDLEFEGDHWGCNWGHLCIDHRCGTGTIYRSRDFHEENPGALETLRRLLDHFKVRTLDEFKGKTCLVRFVDQQIQSISPVGTIDEYGRLNCDWFDWRAEFDDARSKLLGDRSGEAYGTC